MFYLKESGRGWKKIMKQRSRKVKSTQIEEPTKLFSSILKVRDIRGHKIVQVQAFPLGQAPTNSRGCPMA